MSDQERIQLSVARLRRVRRAQLLLEHLVIGLFWGSVPAALAVLASKLWMIPLNMLIVALFLFVSAVVVFAVLGVLHRVTPLAVAADIDMSLGLRERVSSALALSPKDEATLRGKPVDPFVRTLVHDAARSIETLPRRKVYPWLLPRAWKLALPALLIAGLLCFVPQLNWFVSQSDRAQAKLVQNEGKQLMELARQLEEQAKKQQDPVIRQSAKTIKRIGEQLASGQMTKREALKKLQSLSEKLQSQNQPPQGEQQLSKELGQELSKGTLTKELGEKLQQGDMKALAEQLKEMQEKAAKGQLTPDDRKRLEEMTKALQDALKSDAAKSPGAQELRKNLEQLQQALQQQAQAQQNLQQSTQNMNQTLQNIQQQLSQNGLQNYMPQLNQMLQQAQQMQQQAAQTGQISQQSMQQMQQQLQQLQQQVQNDKNLSQEQKDQLADQAKQAQEALKQAQSQSQQSQQSQQQVQQQAQKNKECSGGG